jgi:hypothetical protein
MTAEAGIPLPLVVGFRPGTYNADAFPGRSVRDPSEWRLRPLVLDDSGDVVGERGLGRLDGELFEFEWAGVERENETVVWESPKPLREDGRRYLWGRGHVPQEPGKYRFVVRLYPTADRFSLKDPLPDFGPGVDVFERPIRVSESRGEARTGLNGSLRRVGGHPAGSKGMGSSAGPGRRGNSSP